MFRKTLTSLVFNHKVDAELRRLARKYVKG